MLINADRLNDLTFLDVLIRSFKVKRKDLELHYHSIWDKAFSHDKAKSLLRRKVLKTTEGFYEQHVTLERWTKVYYRKNVGIGKSSRTE